MEQLRYHCYKGEIMYEGRRFSFEPANERDIEQLAGLYADIAIHAENYKEKLDPSDPNSFAATGGMFVVHTEDSIREELARNDSFFAVLKQDDNEIIASFWFSLTDPHFADFKPSSFPGCTGCECTLSSALKNGTAVCARELIVSPKAKGFAHAMFFTVFSAMRMAGYTHSLCEVYGLNTPLQMLNERSFRMTSGVGGKYLGVAPPFEIALDTLTVAIAPRVFCFDFAALLPGLANKIEAAGMNIVFHEVVRV